MPFAQRIVEGFATWLHPVRSTPAESPPPPAGPQRPARKTSMNDLRCAVSEEYRFVYVVTPKVACTSVKTALLPLFGRDPAEAGERGQAHKILARAGAIENGNQFMARLESHYRDYFKFSFVRNPFDRLVSCYYSKINPHVVGIDQEPYDGVELRPGMSFEEFAEAVCMIPDEKANVHFRSQHRFLYDQGAEGTPFVDFLGRFENMEEDFGRVAERIGVELSLPHSNRSKRRRQQDYRGFYNPELARKVGERYRKDCELFGYSF